MRILLIDDEQDSLDVLKYDLHKIDPSLEIIGDFNDPLEGMKAIKQMKPDAVFLDIEMPKLGGFEILDLLGESISFDVIFATAYQEYAIKAFEYYAVSYLLKPIGIKELKLCIDNLKSRKRRLKNEEVKEMQHMYEDRKLFNNKLVLPLGTSFKILDIEDIVRCQSDSNYTEIYMKDDKKYVVSKSLKHYNDILQHNNFLRVHQSHLINPEYIDEFAKSDGGYLKLKSGKIISVSRVYKKGLFDFFKKIANRK